MEQEYLSSQDVADKLNLKHKTITKWFTDGKIPGALQISKTRGGWRISKIDFEKWLETTKIKGENE